MERSTLYENVEKRRDQLVEMSRDIWEHPELGLHEERSSKLHQDALAAAGFEVETGIGGMPTAFAATYGSDEPRIGILGEFDALPGLSQKVSAKRDPVEEGAPGHGCGHNLFGVAGVGAALALADAIDAGEIEATVVFYGCPAEETLVGKTYMARDGAFDDLDAALTWHPGKYTMPSTSSTLAMDSIEFEFSGQSAHAAASPTSGRSALDAVQLLNTGVEYVREHVPDEVRIHYSITDGGGAPNVVPATASVWYFVRAPERDTVAHVRDWVEDVAEGAATMTRTSVERTVVTGCYNVLPNETIADVVHDTMQELGPFEYDDDQRAFAGELKDTLDEETIRSQLSSLPDDVTERAMEHSLFTEPLPSYDGGEVGSGSTEVGDVSWIAPIGRFRTATWPVGTPAHTWQAVAANGSFAPEGMLYAAKVIAGTGARLATEPDTLDAAQEEFDEARGDRTYETPLPPEAEPPFHLTADD